MIIGKYVFHRSKTIKKRIENRDTLDNDIVVRMIQVYNSRFLGLCFYRNEDEYNKLLIKFNVI